MPVTVPNQFTLKIKKEKCDKENHFAQINLIALQDAMVDLSGEAFKLWLYLAKNQNNYTLALSPVDAIKWGIGSRSSYNRAKAQLIEKNYLIETSPNHYDFYEKAQDCKDIITVKKEFEF